MELIRVDGRGRSCPEPVLLTKKALKNNPATVEVIVDNATARDNVRRLAGNSGYEVQISEANDGFIMILKSR